MHGTHRVDSAVTEALVQRFPVSAVELFTPAIPLRAETLQSATVSGRQCRERGRCCFLSDGTILCGILHEPRQRDEGWDLHCPKRTWASPQLALRVARGCAEGLGGREDVEGESSQDGGPAEAGTAGAR